MAPRMSLNSHGSCIAVSAVAGGAGTRADGGTVVTILAILVSLSIQSVYELDCGGKA